MLETLRVLKPGGLLVANVWIDFDLIRLAGAMMHAVTGPREPPPPNPTAPLSLANAPFFDDLLKDAGFEFTTDHNHSDTIPFKLGSINDEQSFKMAALPIWDTLAEFEENGTFPDAWAKAAAAWPSVAKQFADTDGSITIEGTFRIAVARKPT